MQKKILVIFGTRPEAIKLAPVIKALRAAGTGITVKTCITAQHREMLDQVLPLFEIVPDHDLNIMAPGQDLFGVTQKALQGLERVLKEEMPDLVLAQGDTTTVFTAALAAYYQRVPFGHVEAGLRTDNKYSPFPEEINRQLASRIADLHFAPTAKARDNLLKEGIPSDKIFVTGNTVIDALFYTLNAGTKALRHKGTKENSEFGIRNSELNSEESIPQSAIRNPHSNNTHHSDTPELTTNNCQLKTILLTAHRRENFGDGMENICKSVLQIVSENEDVEVVYPVHLNPNVQDPVNKYLRGQDRVRLIEPMEYAQFVSAMEQSYLILTDSGGVQEEAPSLGKPVLVMRETTERPEAVEAGTVKLVGTAQAVIVKETNRLLQNSEVYQAMSAAHNPYGDGTAAGKIADICREFLAKS
ncbi:non-hydrolyzing UDP-N-acetylglucosamine 2-epimerase [Candidatus Margulisiibacteriota bacterium]